MAKKNKISRSEKRRHPRYPVGITMDIHEGGGLTQDKVRGTITDLSISGMTFKTNKQLEEGSMLYLKINIPLEIRGEVRHIRGGAPLHRYGVRFHKIGFAGSGPRKPASFINAKFRKK